MTQNRYINIHQFKNNMKKECENLPVVVTVRGIPMFTVSSLASKSKERQVAVLENNGGISRKEYKSLESVTDREMQDIANSYRVPVDFVRGIYEDLVNYCESKGKKYDNYLAALKSFVRREMNGGYKNARPRSIDASKVLREMGSNSRR